VLPTFGIGILVRPSLSLSPTNLTRAQGPGLFGLGLGESVLCIVFVNLIAAAIPAYFSIFGAFASFSAGTARIYAARQAYGPASAK
jgi:purine-cytosine permease-like protein